VVRDAGGAGGADGHVADAAEMIDKRPIDLVADVLLPVGVVVQILANPPVERVVEVVEHRSRRPAVGRPFGDRCQPIVMVARVFGDMGERA